MNYLKAPDEFSGGCAEGDHGIGPFVVAEAKSAEIIRASAAGGNENEIMFRIYRERRPGISGARVRTGVAGPRDGIPSPAQFSGACVESANDAAADVYFPIVGD